ncbi:MAG: hypothetical protein GX331_03720 [Firmicutes bacterium]|nr:hypothetical protein [Bacillota bacterium]
MGDNNKNGEGANSAFLAIFVSLGVVFYVIFGNVLYLVGGITLGLVLSQTMRE